MAYFLYVFRECARAHARLHSNILNASLIVVEVSYRYLFVFYNVVVVVVVVTTAAASHSRASDCGGGYGAYSGSCEEQRTLGKKYIYLYIYNIYI